MKVACAGGGPAGLYLSFLLKRQDPSHGITGYERDPEGSTYGWGVTYWRGLLDRLHEQDPVSPAPTRACAPSSPSPLCSASASCAASPVAAS